MAEGIHRLAAGAVNDARAFDRLVVGSLPSHTWGHMKKVDDRILCWTGRLVCQEQFSTVVMDLKWDSFICSATGKVKASTASEGQKLVALCFCSALEMDFLLCSGLCKRKETIISSMGTTLFYL